MRADQTWMRSVCIAAVLMLVCASALGDGKGVKKAKKKAKSSPSPVTYYVSTTGSDSNTGLTSSKAFKTIQKAVNTISVAGSSIYVAPGTYNETVTLSSTVKSGTAVAPMRLIGDEEGTYTGTAPGSVIINGAGTRAYGILFNGGSNWSFSELTIKDQKTANVYTGASNIAGMVFDECTFHVTPQYGFYFANNGNLTLSDNTFVRTPTSGHVTYIYQTSGTAMTITGNTLTMTGEDYFSTDFRNGTLFRYYTSYTSASYAYGLIAMAYPSSGSITMTVTNNVVSDAYLGIYAYLLKSGSKLNCSNNTTVGCYYGLYVYTDNGCTGTINNNIAGDSYVSTYVYAPQCTIDSLLAWGMGYNPCKADTWKGCSYVTVKSMTNIMLNQLPSFADPANGDFALTGTVGIDAGTATGAPSADFAGTARPIDGDGDGKALVDLGAFESPLQTQRTLRIIQWQEIGADE